MTAAPAPNRCPGGASSRPQRRVSPAFHRKRHDHEDSPIPRTALAAAQEQDGTILLTIMLKHDESKTLPQINAELKASSWFRGFPPPGTKIVSCCVMMGIGQVVTVRVPAGRLRDVNRVIENSARGGFRTGFHPTHDYRQGWRDIRKRMNAP